MFTFTAKTDGKSESYDLAPGYYVAEVRDAIEKKAKSGNPMIELHLSVRGENGIVGVRDYLVFSDKAIWKIEQFLYAIGKDLKPGDNISVDENDLIGRLLTVETTLENGDKQGVQFPKIERFMRDADAPFRGPKPVSNVPQNARTAPAKGRMAEPDMEDDDIPF